MIITTTYIQPDITIESELIGLKKFYIYNYKGVHFRVFNSLADLQKFISWGKNTWSFECEKEDDLEIYFNK